MESVLANLHWVALESKILADVNVVVFENGRCEGEDLICSVML